MISPCDSDFVRNVHVGDFISDHAAIRCQLDFSHPTTCIEKMVPYRRYHRIDINQFRNDLSNIPFVLSPGGTAAELFDQYLVGVTWVLDKHAPIISHMTKRQSDEWLSDSYRMALSLRGQFERKWRKFNDAPELVPPAFNTFKPVTEDEVNKCINKSPTKSCPLDPIPTFLLKDCLDILLPSITKLVNYSLIDGSFPNAFKIAVVTPPPHPTPPTPIKKASLPRNDLKSYRPVSGLCFLSKLVERVAKQLTSCINNNKLDNPHQSAFKPGHSTETALLSIKNEVHLSLARSEPTALVLLDLSAMFDTMVHKSILFVHCYCEH